MSAAEGERVPLTSAFASILFVRKRGDVAYSVPLYVYMTTLTSFLRETGK